MITLTVIVYVVICLRIAYYKYTAIEFDSRLRNINPCFENTKKSLAYGFLIIPFCLFVLGMLIGLVYLFVLLLGWIITHLP